MSDMGSSTLIDSAGVATTAGVNGTAGAQATALGEVIEEFGRHLELLADQLGASMSEADRESMSVGESFHRVSAARSAIEAVHCAEPERGVIRESCRQIGDALHGAVVALQYHDRLAQRLGLVRAGLIRLQTLLEERSPRSYDEWLVALREVAEINCHEQKRVNPPLPRNGDADPAVLSQDSVELF